PEADAVVVDVVDDAAVAGHAELVARGEQECPLVARLPEVDVADHVQEALEAWPQGSRVLAAVLNHPPDVVHRTVPGRGSIPAVAYADRRSRRMGAGDARPRCRGGRYLQEPASLHVPWPLANRLIPNAVSRSLLDRKTAMRRRLT